MPLINDILHDDVIGISFLDRDENQRVEEPWNHRFRPDQSIWIRASGSDEAAGVMKTIYGRMKEQGNEIVSGLQVILAGFLDLRAEDAEAQCRLMTQISEQLTVLGCVVSLQIHFGYIGNIPVPNREDMRSCAKMAAQYGTLCLVGKYAFDSDGGNNWRAVVLMLDALRRNSDCGALMPKPGNGTEKTLGFLKYAEFSQRRLDELEEQKRLLEQKLSDEGSDALSNGIQACMNVLDDQVKKDFPVNGGLHPYHPDLIVENRGIINNRRKAERGRYEPFNAAAKATVEAVEATANRMKERMLARYVPDDNGAVELLRQLLEKSGTGLKKLLELTDLGEQLSLTPDKCGIPDVLILKYSQTGYGDQIDYYLKDYRKYCLSLCKQELLKQLQRALEQLKPEFEKQIPLLQDELNKINTRLSRMPQREQFLGMLAKGGERMEMHFNPTNPDLVANMAKMVLWREREDEELVRKYCEQYSYQIDREHGNLKQVDDAQIKAIFFFQAVCNDLTLADIIK